ncbi:MAG: tail fiber protein [Solirubrobacteraceae bacterium]
MPIFTNPGKWALRRLTGGNPGLDIDAGFTALADDIDPLLTPYTSGLLSARPVSTPATPGKAGRSYRATDRAGQDDELSKDHGTGWVNVALTSNPTISNAYQKGQSANLGNSPAAEGTADASLNLKHTLAGLNQKYSRLLNIGGVTYLESVNDAYSAQIKTGFSFNHVTGLVSFPNGLKTDQVSPNAGARLKLQGGLAGAGETEVWDRASISDGHAFGSFPDPGPGGLYVNKQLQVAGSATVGSGVQATSLLIPGEMKAFAGAAAPTGWLFCNGQAISRTTYAALFGAIGTAHGAGDGSTTFNVPDARGRSLIGHNGTTRILGAVGGEVDHALTTAEIPLHNHDPLNGFGRTAVRNDAAQINVLVDNGAGGSAGIPISTSGTGGGAQHNNMPPFLVVNWIIKV